MRFPLAACIAVLTTTCAARAAAPAEPQAGAWRAWLTTPGGELPFGLDLRRDGARWQCWIVNGAERIEVPRLELNAGELTLGIDHYDATITARLSDDGKRLDGKFKRRRSAEKWIEADFAAAHGNAPRFAPLAESVAAESASFAGRWQVSLGQKGAPAVGVFEQDAGGIVTGTFLTPGGDYGACAGRADGNRLRLSRFEGVHAFLFDASLGDDGKLRGEYWTASGAHETWVATRDEQAALPEGLKRPEAELRADLAALEFRTPDGKPVRLSDPQFRGAGLVIEVLGSWCPNCHDAAKLLEELHREYGGLGLAVVGLAFELTGDFERDARLVKLYAERHKLTYPVLVAGRADKAEVAAKLPFLKEFSAYPTAVFVRGDGRVLAVHSGFSGPATGKAYEQQRQEFQRLVEELLHAERSERP